MGESLNPQLFVGGKRVPAILGQRLDVVNPATELVIGSIPAGSAEDVDAAVDAAHAAFPAWAATPASERAAVLRSIATEVRRRRDDLAILETLDCGKPLDEAKWDIDDVADCFDYYATLADGLAPQTAIEVGMPEFKSAVRRAPAGVVALITPWNYPLLMATWKLAPALAAGCCMVLKPSELASLTCLEFGAICDAAHVPAGVVQIVTGLGAAVGAPLAAHPRIQKISFTGSNATGRLVAAAAARNLTPCSLELGGKSALIVFEDTDLDKAVEWAMFGCFWTNGQICSSTSRLLVQESVAASFYEKLKQRAECIRISDPMQEDCRMGPLVSSGQYSKVVAMVEKGVAEGATLLSGGKRPAELQQGYYLQPTIFTGVTPNMTIWREEIFGPVLSAATFTSEAQAIEMANDSPYGLAAAVISDDPQRCSRVADALDVGIVWVNCSQPCFCQAPWGGRKQSGIGRELGTWGLDGFLAVKQVTEYVSADKWDWYPEQTPSRL